MSIINQIKNKYTRHKFAAKIALFAAYRQYKLHSTNMPQLVIEELKKKPSNFLGIPPKFSIQKFNCSVAQRIDNEKALMLKHGVDYDEVKRQINIEYFALQHTLDTELGISLKQNWNLEFTPKGITNAAQN
jgi:hypothetical protein